MTGDERIKFLVGKHGFCIVMPGLVPGIYVLPFN